MQNERFNRPQMRVSNRKEAEERVRRRNGSYPEIDNGVPSA